MLSLLTCQIVCSAFTAFPLGHNTWGGGKKEVSRCLCSALDVTLGW